jgi:hypothetical protein
MEENKRSRISYNYNYLTKFCFDNNLTFINDHSNDNITGESFIKIKCIGENCENICNKKFKNLVTNKNFGCLVCTPKLKLLKTKNTIITKYGVDSLFKLKEINDKIKQTMINKYGCEHALQSNLLKNKFKQTCIEKFGVENPTLNQEVKNKVKQTCIKKFGVENPFQCNEIKNKIKKYNLNKYGFECNSKSKELKNKYKQTCLEKYGTDSHTKNSVIKEKIKKSNIIKYGFENVMHNTEVMDKLSKNAYKLKEYYLPSGKIIKIQGYENYAIDCLIKNDNIEENDIVTGVKNVPEIWYSDKFGKKHRHYVDIFIPSQNKCIEVKSTWTAKKKEDNIILKQNAAKELGFEYEIWIFDKKANKVQVIT